MADDSAAPSRSEATYSRDGVLKRGAAAAFSVAMFGGIANQALGATYGPLKFQKQLASKQLRILQWVHFVPAYDKWFDNTYIKAWGEKNDTEVKVDHINNALLFSTGASQVAAQSGHDLFQFLSPPSSFQKQLLPLTDIVQEVTKKLGPISSVGEKSTFNPKTKQYFGFADNYVPDPAHYRGSLFTQIDTPVRTWEDIRKAAPALKALGKPIGLGMSNEIDSNMFLFALLYCYGGLLQNEENQPIFAGKSRKGAVEALKLMQDIFKQGMSDEVFAWTAASNNQAFIAGRLSFAMNAISIARTLERVNPGLADDTWLAPIPRGPFTQMGNEHVMGVYVIWKFAKNVDLAKKFLVDQQLGYKDHFEQSAFYNFPGWTGAIEGGFPAIRKMAAADTHKPRGKYTVLTTIAEKYTANVGWPGYSNAAIDEIFNRFLVPQMFAQVVQGKLTPDEAVTTFGKEFTYIHRKWRNAGLV
ncbi:MAG: carbohydrate ABC transporter substrate-binding protein [Thermoleophilia bacterium]|nr:carbohydrate ABC transporter substrate-binding protein [Thermoleophilia bacterium]